MTSLGPGVSRAGQPGAGCRTILPAVVTQLSEQPVSGTLSPGNWLGVYNLPGNLESSALKLKGLLFIYSIYSLRP